MIRSSGLKTHTEQNKMNDSLTASVARLHRAGSEYSQQTKKSREAVDRVILWIKKNWPDDLNLPQNCKVYPSGEFEFKCRSWYWLWQRWVIAVSSFFHIPYDPSMSFRLIPGKEHSIDDLNQFSKLIANGFLDKMSSLLEEEVEKSKLLSSKINEFFDETSSGEGR